MAGSPAEYHRRREAKKPLDLDPVTERAYIARLRELEKAATETMDLAYTQQWDALARETVEFASRICQILEPVVRRGQES